MSDTRQEEAHTGPIKTPKQLLLAVFLAFVVPIFIIIALVVYVVNENKPAGSTQAEVYALGGMTARDLERATAERIRKVGTVEIRDANRPLKSGEDVFKAQCATCHATGVAGAPKLGDKAAWGPRIAAGFEALVQSAVKGKGAMPPQAGGDMEQTEIARAVAYMANAAGASFAEPKAPEGAAATAAASAPAAVPTAGAAAPLAAAPVAPATAAAAPAQAPAPAPVAAPAAAPAAAAPAAADTGGAGEALYKQACFACHATGAAGAPKLGDKAAWASRVQQGLPALVQSVVKGKGAMPPKGGSNASEQDIRAAVEYMVDASR
jgi:cytochrome c5